MNHDDSLYNLSPSSPDPEMKPGVYRHISNDDYHAGEGVSKSQLDLIDDAPIELRAIKTGAVVRKSTASQALGTAFHSLVLEPEDFAVRYTQGLGRADVPEAIDERDELVAMVAELNSGRLAKLPSSGDKATVIARIIDAYGEMLAAPGRVFGHPAENLEAMKGAELKAEIERLNESRQGLLPTSGTKAELAAILRANDVEVVLWGDVLAQWERDHEGRDVLTAETWIQLHNMRDAVFAHPAARKLFRKGSGEAELSCYCYMPVIYPATGAQMIGPDGQPVFVLVRCRPDWLRYDGIIADLKSCQPGGAAELEFARSIDGWRYFVQDPFYLDVTAAALAVAQDNGDDFAAFAKPHAFVFVAVENNACVVDGVAKGVAVHQLGEDSRALGRAVAASNIATYAECERLGKWPGYSPLIQPIELPPYAFQRIAVKLGYQQQGN